MKAVGPAYVAAYVALRSLYEPRGPGIGAADSTSAALSSIDHSRSVTPAAIAQSHRATSAARSAP